MGGALYRCRVIIPNIAVHPLKIDAFIWYVYRLCKTEVTGILSKGGGGWFISVLGYNRIIVSRTGVTGY